MYCRRSNTLRQLRGGFLQSWRAGRSHNVFGPERPTHKGCLRLTISKNTPLCFQRGGRGVEGRRAGGDEGRGGGSGSFSGRSRAQRTEIWWTVPKKEAWTLEQVDELAHRCVRRLCYSVYSTCDAGPLYSSLL